MWNTWNSIRLPLTLMDDHNVPLSLNSQSSFQNILPTVLYLDNNLMCCHFVLHLDLSFSNLNSAWYNVMKYVNNKYLRGASSCLFL